MGTLDILGLIDSDQLSASQVADLRRKLLVKKRELAAATKKVDRGLKLLARKRKSKRGAKRKSVR